MTRGEQSMQIESKSSIMYTPTDLKHLLLWMEQKYLTEDNMTELEALTKSYAHATGEEKCAVNMPAAGKFWILFACFF